MRLINADALLESVKVIGESPLPDVRTLKDLEQAIVNTYYAILNEITNAPTVEREGWKLVPIEPTDAMINACDEAAYQYDFHQRHKGKFSIPKIYDVQLKYVTQIGQFYYKAMLAAAPKE
jgi:hypothetical protein